VAQANFHAPPAREKRVQSSGFMVPSGEQSATTLNSER
jgi:hypothetical protein